MIDDQPPPIAQPERRAVWDLVVADFETYTRKDFGMTDDEEIDEEISVAIIIEMKERDRLGRQRYGTPLTTHNGRDHLVDSYQEALDHSVYLRAWLEENHGLSVGPKRSSWKTIRELYQSSIERLWLLRYAIAELKKG